MFQTEAGQQSAAAQGANSWRTASLAEMDRSWELGKRVVGIPEAFSSRSRHSSSQMSDPLQLFKPSADSTRTTNFIPQSSFCRVPWVSFLTDKFSLMVNTHCWGVFCCLAFFFERDRLLFLRTLEVGSKKWRILINFYPLKDEGDKKTQQISSP